MLWIVGKFYACSRNYFPLNVVLYCAQTANMSMRDKSRFVGLSFITRVFGFGVRYIFGGIALGLLVKVL